MKTVWRIIGLVGLGLLTLGAVCIVVGLITGGSTDRIMDTLFANYNIEYYVKIAQQFITSVF